jgi:hypothetical protein
MLSLLDVMGEDVEDPPVGTFPFRSASSLARVTEASRQLEEAAVAVENSEWWAGRKTFLAVPLSTFQDELRLKTGGLGDTHIQYLASRFEMGTALLVSTFKEMGEGVDPSMVHKFYELSDAAKPYEKIALLHLRDMGHGGHFEAVLCDGIGSLCSDHPFLEALRVHRF